LERRWALLEWRWASENDAIFEDGIAQLFYFFQHVLVGMKTSEFFCLTAGTNAHTVKMSRIDSFGIGAHHNCAPAF
jgi:hypothetical protein